MQPIDKRNLVAQWAFDTRPVLLRFHLWLEDVERGAGPAGAGLGARVHAARHRPMPRDDLRGHGARDAPLRRLRRGGGEGQGDAEPGEEVGGRDQRLRDERGAVAPDAHPSREPRDHGLPRRGADAEGGGDPGDGREPAPRLRPRLRPPRGGARRGPEGPPAAERAGAHVRAVPRLAAEAGDHALGRRRRHAREHVALRRGEGDGPDVGLSPLRLAARPVAPVRVVHGLPHGAAARGRGGRPRLAAARLPDAARAR